jgi:hypothetical protein
MQLDADAPQITISSNGRRRGKERLLTRDRLDRRTGAAKLFDQIATGIAQDLGGEHRLSTVRKHLVEAFAGVALHVHDINARLLLGEKIDVLAHSNAVSTLVRVATKIGLDRIPRELGDDIEADDPAFAVYRRTLARGSDIEDEP